MPNTHASPDFLSELSAQHYDLLPACIVSSTWPTAPGSGLTLAAFATQGYVRAGSLLSYVDQPARAVTLPSSDGTYYLALTKDTHSTPGSFTRVAGSHYAYLQSASAPTYPDGSTPIASAVVSGGTITAVDPAIALTPPLSRQTADAVAITDGRIALGGHASTGVLDVQSSVVASDVANAYLALRVWPVAPSGATTVQGYRVEAATGVGLATTHFRGIAVNEQPAMAGVVGLESGISAGAGRANIYCNGTALNYFAGPVGMGNATPSYPLDVTGNVRMVGGTVGVGTAPTPDGIRLFYARASAHGINIQPNQDTGGFALNFQNAAGTSVGSISTTAAATSFNTSSDVRLKESIKALVGALDVITALNPVSFRWQADGSKGIGFLAHELMRIVPEAVTGEPDAVGTNGEILPQQVDHSRLLPWAMAGMKELVTMVESLTARVASLEEALGL